LKMSLLENEMTKRIFNPFNDVSRGLRGTLHLALSAPSIGSSWRSHRIPSSSSDRHDQCDPVER